MLREDFDLEMGEIADYRKMFRRLASAVVLSALTDLTDGNILTRARAILYLKNEGAEILDSLGIRHNLDAVISNPPPRRLIRSSAGRQPFTSLHGQRQPRTGIYTEVF